MLARPGAGGLMAKTKRRPSAKSLRKGSPRNGGENRRARRGSATDVALASLAHEIRTPLTGILALAELLHASDLPEREQRWAEAIRRRRRSSGPADQPGGRCRQGRCGGLALARGELSRRRIWRGRSRACSRRAPKAKASRPRSDIGGGLPSRVIGDPVRLRGALENLIDNAVKFTDRGRIAFAVSSARARTRTHAADFRGDRQRHRHQACRTQAAVSSVCAGERRHRAALRRRGPRSGLRAADRRGDGRRAQGHQQAGTRQHVPHDGDGAKRNGRRRRARTPATPTVIAGCACFASRTTLMAASCSAPCFASSATASALSEAARPRSRPWRATSTTWC